jgi:uncharacterized protein YlxW (UPF0749 family)
MEGLFKNRVFLFSVLLNFSLLTLWVASCSETRKERAFRENDLRDKLIAEERLDKFDKERQGLQEQVETLQKQLEQEVASHELTKKALLQEQLVTKVIKDELSRVTKGGDKP